MHSDKDSNITISQFEKKLQEVSPNKNLSTEEGQLVIDVFQKNSELIILAPIAGVSAHDIDISIENHLLIIKGSRENPEKSEAKNYFYQECFWGKFQREISLPDNADVQHAKASFKKGILKITIPLLEKEKKKKIDIE